MGRYGKNNTTALCRKDGRIRIPVHIIRQLGIEPRQYYRFEITDLNRRIFRIIKVE